MAVQCVRCTFPLPEPLTQNCPHCGAPTDASLPRLVAPAAAKADAPADAPSPSQIPAESPLPSTRSTPPAPYEPYFQAPTVARPPNHLGAQPLTASPLPTAPAARSPNSRRNASAIGVGLALLLVVAAVGANIVYSALTARGSLRQHPLATATATAGPIRDSLLVSETNWPIVPTKCFFGSGGYHVANNSICPAPLPAFGSGSIRVDLALRPGTGVQEVAVLFRETSIGNEYGFFLDASGRWGITRTLDGNLTVLLPLSPNAAIHIGPNASNTLLIQLSGSHFTFFANGTQLGTVDDDALPRGGLAFATIPGVEAIFSNLEVIPAN